MSVFGQPTEISYDHALEGGYVDALVTVAESANHRGVFLGVVRKIENFQ